MIDDILGFLGGVVIFWLPYFVYKYFSNKYWERQRTEWDKEIRKGIDIKFGEWDNELRKELGTDQFDEIRRDTKRAGKAQD